MSQTHLKSIVIHGFKSFAKPTQIKFCNGLNLIVGPEGSGRHNLLSALAWGFCDEGDKQRTKDILFRGNKICKKANFAEIEMCLGQDENDLFDVTYKRRIDKKGNTSYFLNGKECKSRDEYESVKEFQPVIYQSIISGKFINQENYIKTYFSEKQSIYAVHDAKTMCQRTSLASSDLQWRKKELPTHTTCKLISKSEISKNKVRTL